MIKLVAEAHARGFSSIPVRHEIPKRAAVCREHSGIRLEFKGTTRPALTPNPLLKLYDIRGRRLQSSDYLAVHIVPAMLISMGIADPIADFPR